MTIGRAGNFSAAERELARYDQGVGTADELHVIRLAIEAAPVIARSRTKAIQREVLR
jgi:hypothetical protein